MMSRRMKAGTGRRATSTITFTNKLQSTKKEWQETWWVYAISAMMLALLTHTVKMVVPSTKVNVALLNMGEKHSQAAISNTAETSATNLTTLDALQILQPPNSTNRIQSAHPANLAETIYSCDIGSEHVSLPVFPTFIIIGAHKSGTTALYKLLDKISGVMPSKEFEPHFFDQQYNRYIHNIPPYKDKPSFHIMTKEQRMQLAQPITHHEEELQLQNTTKICEFRKKYFDDNFNNEKFPVTPQTITFEKTPALITYPYAPKFINAICPHKPKIIMMVREPIERAYSDYKMDWQRTGKWRLQPDDPENKSFDQLVKTEVQDLVQLGLIKAPFLWYGTNETQQTDEYWSTLPDSSFEIVHRHKGTHLSSHTTMIHRGLYARQLQPWLEVFPLHTHLKVLRHDRFVEDPSRILQEILDFVGFEGKHNLADEQLREDLSPSQKINKHTGLSWVHPPLHNGTKAYLKRVYSGFNSELAPLLGPEWNDVWDY